MEIATKVDAELPQDKVVEITEPKVIFSGTIQDLDDNIARVDERIAEFERRRAEYVSSINEIDGLIAGAETEKDEWLVLRDSVVTQTGFKGMVVEEPVEEPIIP